MPKRAATATSYSSTAVLFNLLTYIILPVCRHSQLTLAAANVKLQTMKRKSTDISSYFKKKISTGGEREPAVEQQRHSDEETEEEDEREQHEHDSDTQARPVASEHHDDEEEVQTAADAEEGWLAEIMGTEARQGSAAGVQPAPTGKIMTVCH